MKKNIRNGLIFGTIALLLISCSNTGVPQNGQNADQAVITVTGSGEVNVVPDIGYINVGVRSRGATVSEAISVNNESANAIKASLLEQGVAEEDIQTSNFNVYQQSDYDFQGNPTDTYFMVENSVYVTVRQIESMGEVLDAVAKGGANNIYGVNFDVQDKTEALSTARELAVQSAQVQARELADAANVELGEIISINASTSTTEPFYGYGIGGGGGMESVPISSGQIPVSTQVQVTFSIKK